MPILFLFPLPEGWRWIDAGGACSCGYEQYTGWPPAGIPGSNGLPEYYACEACGEGSEVFERPGDGRPPVYHIPSRGADGQWVWTPRPC